jgi:hypothetical protein
MKPPDIGRIKAGLLAGGPAGAVRLIPVIHIPRESEYNKKQRWNITGIAPEGS